MDRKQLHMMMRAVGFTASDELLEKTSEKDLAGLLLQAHMLDLEKHGVRTFDSAELGALLNLAKGE